MNPVDKNREHKRIDKTLTLLFCLADANPKRWDMSVIENISVGGIRFIAPVDLDLENKIVQLKIKIPELAPRFLELEAIVLSTEMRFNTKSFDVRAKFINLSEEDKKQLSVVERMISLQEVKDSSKIYGKDK